MSRSLLVVSFSVLINYCLLSLDAYHGIHFDELNYGVPDEILSQKGDLYDYMEALKRIIEFFSKNKLHIDLNVEFGLFLTNVNLKLALEEKSKRLPKKLSHFLKSLLDDNNMLIEYFELMVSLNQDPSEGINKMISSLFTNDTKWISRVRRYRYANWEKNEQWYGAGKGKLSSIYVYIKKIQELHKNTPTPKLSDLCFRSLASNIDYQLRTSAKCVLYDPCYYALERGTNFGYSLSHRILLLLNARLARGCHIFSSDKDRRLSEKFCKIAYDEIQFVTTQGYEIIDLILEFITLCALDGHVQFLRQAWLSKSLQFQSSYGCFGATVADASKTANTTKPTYYSWKLAKIDHRLLGGVCDGHITSVAAATLSAAIRYLLETYY